MSHTQPPPLLTLGGKALGPRFWSKVDKNGPYPTGCPELGRCWIWLGQKNKKGGYGSYQLDRMGGKRRRVSAHRLSFIEANGNIPFGLVPDHLCRTNLCVNPSHLEAVTEQVNVLRGVSFAAQNALKTHCHRGHPLSGKNLQINPSGSRRCKTCSRMDMQRYREDRRQLCRIRQ